MNRFTRQGTQDVASLGGAFEKLGGTIRSNLATLVAGFTLAAALREIGRLSEEATTLRNQLRLVTSGGEDLENVLGAIRDVANGTRVALTSTANLFVRLSQSSEELGLSQRQIVDITETVNRTLTLSGASAEQSSNGLLQFGQALAGGILRAEEFNSVIENTPGLAREIAAGLGLTIGALRQEVLAGTVTAQRVIEALQSRAGAVNEQFAKTVPTVSQASQTVRNELLLSVDAFNQATGASELLARGILSAGRGIVETFRVISDVVISSLADMLAGFADTVQLGEAFGVTLGNLQEAFRLLGDVARVILGAIDTGFTTIRNGAQTVRLSLLALGEAVGAVDAANVQEAFDDFERSQNDLILSSLETERALQRLARGFVEVDDTFRGTGLDDRLSEGLEGAAERTAAASARIEEALDRLSGARERLSATPGQARTTELNAKQRANLQGLLELERQREIQRLRGVEPLEAQRLELEAQIERLARIQGPQEVVIARDRIIADLRREQAELTERQLDASQALPDVLAQNERLLRNLRALDPTQARELGAELRREIESAVGTEEQLERARAIGREILKAVITETEERAGPTVGEATARAVTAGLEEALTSGDVHSFAGAFGEALRQSAVDSLTSAFEEAAGTLGGLLDSVLPSSLSGLGAPLSGVLGAAIGAALREDQVSTSAANVASSVTSAQQVRGIVAGPTEIAVAQVGRSIQDAFVESERLLGIIASNTGRIATNTSGRASESEADLAVSGESASLI